VIGQTLARLGRLQQARPFKVAASIVIAVATLGTLATLWVVANRPGAAERVAERQFEHAARTADNALTVIEAGPLGALDRAADAVIVQLASPQGLLPALTLFGVLALGAILAAWLGLALTVLGVLVVGWVVAWPLMLTDTFRGVGELLMGLVPLVVAFATLLQAARVALSGSTPVTAIARNVLNEAVRMKISVVFIVLLLLLLALIPGALTEDQPLRYRVQQWLQYGLGFTTLFLSFLTVFLAVGTVAFEQRDKIIWQTATKPVPHWQYILGKWVGVMTINLILLLVAAGGVYQFTEYLRRQPANGESAYFVDLRGRPTGGIYGPPSTDRRLLERQVLVARVGVEPEPYRPTPVGMEFRVDRRVASMADPSLADRDQLREEILQTFERSVEELVNREFLDRQSRDPRLARTDAVLSRIRAEIVEQLESQYRSIDPGGFREYVFDVSPMLEGWLAVRAETQERIDREVQRRIDAGLAEERSREAVIEQVIIDFQDEGRLPTIPRLTLRYKINAGANDPGDIYRLQLFLNGVPYPSNPRTGEPIPTEASLDVMQFEEFPIELVDERGRAVLGVASSAGNPRTITFPPGGLEMLYVAGGYEANFLRVVAVTWVKLGFIAAVGISAATFLSFSVACLTAFGVLFMAASSRFLLESLDYYTSVSPQGDIQYHRVVIRAISYPVAWIFQTYADLRPTERLVDGRLLSWGSVWRGTLAIGLATLGVLALGLAIFRRRELATYSGS
jgi:hypothetical protein